MNHEKRISLFDKGIQSTDCFVSGDDSYEYVHWSQEFGVQVVSAANLIIWTSPGLGESYQVAAVSARYDAGSTSLGASLQIEALSNGQTLGALGTPQLVASTGTIQLAGSTQIIQRGRVIAAPTTLGDNSALGLNFSGTLTGLTGLAVTVALRRLS